MINLSKNETKIPGVFQISYDRFCDNRGFFAETARLNELLDLNSFGMLQSNESYNKKNVIRGLHFQWDPPMGKLIRAISGQFFDILLDIRKGSPTYKSALIFKLERSLLENSDMWLWAPPGIAHGFFCEQECVVEYICSNQYNKVGEGNISPFANDIEWGLADMELVKKLVEMKSNCIISEKDIAGQNIEAWEKSAFSSNFLFTNK